MAHILIAEDDKNIAKMIDAALSIGGHTGSICEDGKTAISRILNEHFDLVLLDVMLPGADGFKIIQKIGSKQTPVIFLTALGDVSDKVKGLKLGAEDYVVKPFEAVELLARIEVVLRRSHKERNILCYKNIVADIEKHMVALDGNEVILTPKEFDVLVFFMQHQDIALTRERLLSAVWGYGFEGQTRTVDMHVRQIRKKLDLHQALVTIPKLGYRLER